MAVNFFFLQCKITLGSRRNLSSFICKLFKQEGKDLLSINYIFCTDTHLLNINREFLNHDYYTDIISFNLADPARPIEGEIYISVDRVRDNAQQNKVSLKNELHRVIFHGALHLCGYKDKSRADVIKMRQMEDDCLNRYFA